MVVASLTVEQHTIIGTMLQSVERLLALDGPPSQNVLVEAVAGAGKTYTVLECVKQLVRLWPTDLNIILLSFNTDVARVMRGRLGEEINNRVRVSTIHALALGLCREWALQQGEGCDVVIDESHLLSVLIEVAPGRSKRAYQEMLNTLQALRHAGHFPNTTLCGPMGLMDTVLLTTLKDRYTMDMDGTVYHALYHSLKLSTHYHVCLLDEAQDTSTSHRQLLRSAIVPAERSVLCAVGDSAQAIYGFRGADRQALNHLCHEWSMTRLPLTHCFRCPANVVALARCLHPSIEGGVEGLPDDAMELKILPNPTRFVERMVTRVNTRTHTHTTTAAPCLLSRNNGPLVQFLFQTYKTHNKQEHNDNGRTTLLLGWLAPGVATSLHAIRRVCMTQQGECGTRVDQALYRRYLADERIVEPCKAIKLIFTLAFDSKTTSPDDWLDFVEGALLYGSSFGQEEENNNIDCRLVDLWLCTVHASKGLEWDEVYVNDFNLFGCNGVGSGGTSSPQHNDDNEQRQNTNNNCVAVDQDGNLLYIALTRCRRHLVIMLDQQYLHVQSPYLPVDRLTDFLEVKHELR